MKEQYQIFLKKVPALRSFGKLVLTIIYIFSLIIISILYFFYLNPIAWFMPIATQSLMAVIVVIIAYLHLQNAEHYRKKYGELAYQVFFYHYIIPLLVSWYDLFFHPLFISGNRLLPYLISIIIAIVFFIIFILVNIHIERAGFNMITHGMDLYTVFPEETSIVRGEIYSFIRHPLYLSLSCGCFALAFIANNLIAILAAIIQLIPCIFVAKMEDKELLKRVGDAHKDYINSTEMFFPFKRILGFLKLLFLFK